ncbi:hypothetical protein FOXB_17772 [Fusarium oxysporum f. sp. conglutinans Fo5176]|uniref:Uncharacterized protein n=1 Tax=Fusarium oxysporum (strain Fo5176) TaxID=660025 RepID=F9GGI8_FUSOF|nr:hypothetical protein FOXB_17772 [Fusarium oxysporum f. sp. conglutinans Fo5176]
MLARHSGKPHTGTAKAISQLGH